MAELNHSGIITNERRDKNVEFWDRKGLIKMDPHCEERCTHTNVPPSTMMTLAMELLISNRGKASKIFRKGRERAQTPEDNDASNLAKIWVVPEAGSSSRGESPSTASHLKPSLANSDFVVQPSTSPTFIPEKSNAEVADASNAEDDLDIINTFSVADLVGTHDHVIVYSDSDSEGMKLDEKRKRNKKSKRLEQKELVVDFGSEISCENNHEKLSPQSSQHHPNIAKDISDQRSIEFNSLSKQDNVGFNRFVTLERTASSQSKHDDSTESPLIYNVTSQNDNLQHITNEPSVVESKSNEVILKGSEQKSNDVAFQQQLLTELTNQLSKDVDSDMETRKAVRKTSCPARTGVEVVKETRVRSKSLQKESKKRTDILECGSNPCSPPSLPSSSVLSSSLSSSLFSLSSLGSVSSASLPVSSRSSEVTSRASCTSVSPDSDFGNLYLNKKVNMKQRNYNMKDNVESKKSFAQTRDPNNNTKPEGSRDINALQSPINRSGGCAVGRVLTSLNSCSVERERSANDSGSNLTLEHVAKKTTTICSRNSSISPTSPSRKVIHEYSEVLSDKARSELKGNIVSRAVFPDKDDSTKATPVLHLQILSKAKSLNNLNSLDADMLRCFKKRPKVPARKESKEVTQRLKNVEREQQDKALVKHDFSAQSTIHETSKTDDDQQNISTRCHSRGCTVTLTKTSASKQADIKVKPPRQHEKESVSSIKQSQQQESFEPQEASTPDDFSLLDEVVQEINDIHPRVRVVNGSKISLLGERFPTSSNNYAQPNLPRKNVAIFNENPLNNRHARVIETIAPQSKLQVYQAPKQGDYSKNTRQATTNATMENTSIKCSSTIQNTNGHFKVEPKKLDNEVSSNPDKSCIEKAGTRLSSKGDIIAVSKHVNFQDNTSHELESKSDVKDLKLPNTATTQSRTGVIIEKGQETFQTADNTSNMPAHGSKFSSTMQVSLRASKSPQKQLVSRVLRRTQSSGPGVKSPNFTEVHPEYRKWVNEWSSSTTNQNPVTSESFRKNVGEFKRLDSESHKHVKRTVSTGTPSSKCHINVKKTRSMSSEPNDGNENGQSRYEGSRKERHVRFSPKMVGNEMETVKPLNSVSNNNEDDESGVIEPPSMTVKDIRAMFHGGADYKNYAKPRSLSNSSGGSLCRQVNHSKNPSECSNSENVDESKTEVAQQVMSMFQGALDLEKDLAVFQDENANVKAQNVVKANDDDKKQAPTPPPKPPISRKPKKLGNGVWPPPKQQTVEENNNVALSHVSVTPAPEEDIKTSVNKIKTETQNVASFDESLDQFYDVLNDLTS